MEPTFLLVAALGVLLTGIAKSGFGGGIGVIAVPMMAPFIGASAAIGVLLPILLLMDVLTLRVYRAQLSWTLVKPLLPGMLVGIVLGSFLLGGVSERGVQALVGGMGLWVLAQKRWPLLSGRKASSEAGLPPTLLGSLAGLGSTLAHAGAPPIQAYFLSQMLSKEYFLAQVALAVALMNTIKLVPYGALGMLEVSLSPLTLVLIPLAFAGVWLGKWLAARLSGELFFRIMMALLLVNSLWLLAQAAWGA